MTQHHRLCLIPYNIVQNVIASGQNYNHASSNHADYTKHNAHNIALCYFSESDGIKVEPIKESSEAKTKANRMVGAEH